MLSYLDVSSKGAFFLMFLMHLTFDLKKKIASGTFTKCAHIKRLRKKRDIVQLDWGLYIFMFGSVCFVYICSLVMIVMIVTHAFCFSPLTV